jgi:PAS domain S-box-containing protein
MHKLFAKQLAKATGPTGEVDITALGGLVSSAYEEADRDRRRTDRSIKEMIEELDKLNGRVYEAFDVIPEGLVIFDSEDRFVLWNRRYLELCMIDEDMIRVGLKYEDALREGLRRNLFPEAKGREETWLADRLRRHALEQNREELLLADGRWAQVEERRTRDGGSVGIRIDITDIKRREASFRLLFDSNPAPMVVTESATRNILAVNDAAVAQYGYDRDQFLGKTLFDLIAPQDREQVIALAREDKLVRNGMVTRRHQTADGRLLDVAIYSRELNYNGRNATLSAVIDMTERERARDAERRTAEVLGTTITSMADGVLVVDALGKVLIANPAAKHLFGGREDIGSREWAEAYRRFLPDGVTPFPFDQTPISRAVRGEAVDNVEVVMRPPGSTEDVHLVANGRPLRDADGKLRGAVIVYRDVTRAQETERQLRHSQKMEAVGQLTGGIAHDFNNLLTVITGTIEIVSEAVAADARVSGFERMIDDAASRAAELTSHLLAFARKHPLQPRKTYVTELIENTVKLLRASLGERIEIELKLEDDAWPALVDPNQLATALLNLAVNARDAMPNGGRLVFETANVVLGADETRLHSDLQSGSYVMISVADSGVGIPEAMRERVFEPFFTTKSTGKGTGLGLSMVYGFVKQSGGHIKIESEEGRGSTITMYLPRAAEEIDWVVDARTNDAAEKGNETILVVEDDPLVRSYVVAQLDGLGYATRAAVNAAEALAVIDSGAELDLLFTDVVMPGELDGWQLAERARERRPSLRVIFTSGYNQHSAEGDGRLKPRIDMLSKPYRKAELARIVRSALDRAADAQPAPPRPHSPAPAASAPA